MCCCKMTQINGQPLVINTFWLRFITSLCSLRYHWQFSPIKVFILFLFLKLTNHSFLYSSHQNPYKSNKTNFVSNIPLFQASLMLHKFMTALIPLLVSLHHWRKYQVILNSMLVADNNGNTVRIGYGIYYHLASVKNLR